MENVRDQIFTSKLNNQLNNNKKLSKEKFNVKNMKEKLEHKGKTSEKAI